MYSPTSKKQFSSQQAREQKVGAGLLKFNQVVKLDMPIAPIQTEIDIVDTKEQWYWEIELSVFFNMALA
jgi:hypothetical protein